MHKYFQDVFKSKNRDELCSILEGSDACVSPVLSMDEAPNHPHHIARGTCVDIDGVIQPGAAPRFSRTKPEIQSPPSEPGQHGNKTLSDWGFSREEIINFNHLGVVK